jgi:hypothetical protein
MLTIKEQRCPQSGPPEQGPFVWCCAKNWPIQIVLVFLATRLSMVALAWASSMVIPYGPDHPPMTSILDLFTKWDAGWYISIVENGYSYGPDKGSSVAFFPLFPLIVRILLYIIPSAKFCGYLVSNAALLLACLYLYRISYLDYSDDAIAYNAVVYMLIAPVSFFFSSIYTESMFLLLTISALYYARINKWLIAGILGALASATKMLGILIIIPLMVEYFEFDYSSISIRRKNFGINILSFLLVPIGLLAYMILLYVRFSDPFAMISTQRAWGREISSISHAIEMMGMLPPFYVFIFFGACMLTLVSLLGMVKYRMRLSYVVYCLFYMLVIISTGSFKSMPRLVSVLFPCYLLMSVVSSKYPICHELFITIFVLFLSLFTVLFVNGYWFA